MKIKNKFFMAVFIANLSMVNVANAFLDNKACKIDILGDEICDPR